jgi:hypothetical protein
MIVDKQDCFPYSGAAGDSQAEPTQKEQNNITRLTKKLSHDHTKVQLLLSVLGNGILGPGLESRGIELAHLV